MKPKKQQYCFIKQFYFSCVFCLVFANLCYLEIECTYLGGGNPKTVLLLFKKREGERKYHATQQWFGLVLACRWITTQPLAHSPRHLKVERNRKNRKEEKLYGLRWRQLDHFQAKQILLGEKWFKLLRIENTAMNLGSGKQKQSWKHLPLTPLPRFIFTPDIPTCYFPHSPEKFSGDGV